MFLIFGMERHEEGGGANDYICSKDNIESAIAECKALIGTSPKTKTGYSSLVFEFIHVFDTSSLKIVYEIDIYGDEELTYEKPKERPIGKSAYGKSIDITDKLNAYVNKPIIKTKMPEFSFKPITSDDDLMTNEILDDLVFKPVHVRKPKDKVEYKALHEAPVETLISEATKRIVIHNQTIEEVLHEDEDGNRTTHTTEFNQYPGEQRPDGKLSGLGHLKDGGGES